MGLKWFCLLRELSSPVCILYLTLTIPHLRLFFRHVKCDSTAGWLLSPHTARPPGRRSTQPEPSLLSPRTWLHASLPSSAHLSEAASRGPKPAEYLTTSPTPVRLSLDAQSLPTDFFGCGVGPHTIPFSRLMGSILTSPLHTVFRVDHTDTGEFLPVRCPLAPLPPHPDTGHGFYKEPV